jgi:hypothetical protein
MKFGDLIIINGGGGVYNRAFSAASEGDRPYTQWTVEGDY